MNKFSIVKGDIVKQTTDAIVNAANTSLLGGGGVCGAIYKAAGEELELECMKLKGCKTGEAKITKGYKLKAKYVIHTPGPIYKGGNLGEDILLSNCYRNSLMLAEENEIKSIAFPSISTGIYMFPLEKAAVIAVSQILEFLKTSEKIEEVLMVCYDKETYKTYTNVYKQIKQ